jgi:ubiquinone/menaquinone biosynthesis C-methylase UbiE
MYDFEVRERADEDVAAPNYHRLYHGFPIARYWDDDFLSFVEGAYTEGDRVLDLGCGPASLWHQWRRLPSPGRLVGVDLSPGMIAEARSRHPEGEFEVARAHDLPFADGSFDLVVASAVLHHIPDEHLPGALAEIERVLDEHGRLIGREPNEKPFGQEPGWFSGSIMTFRHLVFRATRSREYPEPTLGEHHSPTPRGRLLELLDDRFHVSRVEDRYPFSPYVLRVRSETVAAFAHALDKRLAGRVGAMYCYEADRNFADADDVRRVVALARQERGIDDAEFLAYLECAAVEVEKLFESGDR